MPTRIEIGFSGVQTSSHAGLTLRNNAPTFSVTFIFVGRLPLALFLSLSLSLSLRLGNSACPSTLCPPPPPLFSRLFFFLSLPHSLDHARPPTPRPPLSGPSHRFRSAPAILERVSPTTAAAARVRHAEVYLYRALCRAWYDSNARCFDFFFSRVEKMNSSRVLLHSKNIL